ILIRYLHFLGIFVWIGTLVAEWTLLQPELPRRTIKRLIKIDRVYGVSAIFVVAMGLLMWLGVGKPAEYYSNNPLFILKVTLAIIVGLLSIYPTRFFSRQRKGEDLDTMIVIPVRVRQLVLAQLLTMIVIPLLATLMAAGVGLN
ncbi:MAG: DUF2214 family protein, partial [Bacteroidota bacterium]